MYTPDLSGFNCNMPINRNFIDTRDIAPENKVESKKL